MPYITEFNGPCKQLLAGHSAHVAVSVIRHHGFWFHRYRRGHCTYPCLRHIHLPSRYIAGSSGVAFATSVNRNRSPAAQPVYDNSRTGGPHVPPLPCRYGCEGLVQDVPR